MTHMQFYQHQHPPNLAGHKPTHQQPAGMFQRSSEISKTMSCRLPQGKIVMEIMVLLPNGNYALAIILIMVIFWPVIRLLSQV